MFEKKPKRVFVVVQGVSQPHIVGVYSSAPMSRRRSG